MRPTVFSERNPVLYCIALFVLIAATIGICSVPCRADTIFYLNSGINGTLPAKGDPSLPYFALATFHTNSPGDVTLTMALNLSSGEYIHDWLFNVVSGVTPNFDIQFDDTLSTGPYFESIFMSASQVYSGGSQIKAGLFNIQFTFPTPNDGDRFDGTEQVVFNITGNAITDSIFLQGSASGLPNDGAGGWYSAAGVRGIGPAGAATLSGSIGAKATVAEPSSLLLLGSGLLGLFGYSFRRKK